MLWTTNIIQVDLFNYYIFDAWTRISNSKRRFVTVFFSTTKSLKKTQTFHFVPDIRSPWRTFDNAEGTSMTVFLDWFSKKGGKIIDQWGEREGENKSLTCSSSNTYLYASTDRHREIIQHYRIENWNSLGGDQSFSIDEIILYWFFTSLRNLY